MAGSARRDRGKDYASLWLAAAEFRSRKLCANLNRVAGEDDDSAFVIWNSVD